MALTTRFTALIDVMAPGDIVYTWVPLDIEDHLLQEGNVGFNLLTDSYDFSQDIRQRILDYTGVHDSDLCIIAVMQGRPSILNTSDVDIKGEDDIIWLK